MSILEISPCIFSFLPQIEGFLPMAKIPTISACMIVKDEEKYLPKCLGSIKDFVDEIVIVDTGSQDKTIEMAKSYGARVFEHQWENHFSRHRNQSIGYATGDWIFIIDADEELCPDDGPKLKGFVQSWNDVDAFLITVESAMKGGGKTVHNSLRIFKNHMNIHYEGRVHNELVGVHIGRYIPLRICHYGYNYNGDEPKKKYDRTVKLLLQDIEDNPSHPRPHHYLGISFMSENKYEEAIKEAETAIMLNKALGSRSELYSGSYYVASTAYMRLGDLDKGEHWALEALKKYPLHLDSLFNLSEIFFEKRNRPLFWRYITEYFDLLQQIERDQGKFGTMIFYTTGSKWLGYLYKGCALIEEGHQEKGGRELEKALKSCPDKARYHHLLAGFYKQKNELLESEEEFTQALQESPHRTEIIWDFAQLYKEKNDLDNERRLIEELIRRKPEDKNALFELGLIKLKRNEFRNAVRFFEKVIEIDEKHAEARINMALSLRKLGQFEESICQSLEVIKEQPSSLEGLSNLAYSYFYLKDYAHAKEYFIKIIQIDPDQLDIYVHLSLLFLFNQDLESCIVSCDHLLRLLNLKRDITLNSLADLGNQFHAIAEKMLALDNPNLSKICQEIGQILTAR
jgi:tetratricopeptide (TPR) repeat protein